MKKTDAAPEGLMDAFRGIAGTIKRHGPDEETETFVALASRIGEGLWATITKGVFGGRVYDQFTGTAEIIDLWIHPMDGRAPMPVQWGHQCVVDPIALLFVPADMEPVPARTVSAAAMAFPEFKKIYRLSFGGRHNFDQDGVPQELSDADVPVEGSIYDGPYRQTYTPAYYDPGKEGPDRSTICVRAGLDYIGRRTLGGPILDASGRIAGVLIAPDYGNDSAHAGYYVPIDFILPSVALAMAGAAQKDRGRHKNGIDMVSHRSRDVDFY